MLGSVGISLYLYAISPHILSSMDASGEPGFLLVDSVLLKCISQGRKPGRNHISFYDVASKIMQHPSGQAVAEVHSNSRLWSIDPVLHRRASTSQGQNVQDERRRSLVAIFGKYHRPQPRPSLAGPALQIHLSLCPLCLLTSPFCRYHPQQHIFTTILRLCLRASLPGTQSVRLASPNQHV